MQAFKEISKPLARHLEDDLELALAAFKYSELDTPDKYHYTTPTMIESKALDDTAVQASLQPTMRQADHRCSNIDTKKWEE